MKLSRTDAVLRDFARDVFTFCLVSLLTVTLVISTLPARSNEVSGIVQVRSLYSFDETVKRVKKDVDNKGIILFLEVDQKMLGKKEKIDVRPSTLLIFGNPALGVQFLKESQAAGLDWPVRLLVFQDANKQVWVAYSDFKWIAKRHGIHKDLQPIRMASEVIASITSSVTIQASKVKG